MKKLFILFASVLLPLLTNATVKQQTGTLDIGKETKVSTVDVDSTGGVWIGTDGEGLIYKESSDTPAQRWSKYAGNLPTDVILSSYSDRQGRLWFGTFGDGTFYHKDGAFVNFYSINASAGNIKYCTGITQDKDGRMWFGTGLDGIYVFDENTQDTVHLHKDNSGLQTNTITDIKSNDGNNIYIATGWGMYVANKGGKAIEELKDNAGRAFLRKTWTRYLTFIGDSLWIGTKQGVFIFDIRHATYKRLTTSDGLADDEVRSICSDTKGNVWITHPHSISVISGDNKIYTLDEKELGNVEFHIRALSATEDGRVFAGTKKGIMVLSATMLEESSSHAYWWLLVLLPLFAMAYILRRRHGKVEVKQKNIIKTEPKVPEPKVTSINDKTLERLTSLVIEHISDSSYSVEQLSADMGMSRANLYKKVTAVTGCSPLEFIRNIKVERGRQILEKSGESISQVAWQVGLSPKQFSKYFKEKYNVLPSEYNKK